MSAKAVRPVANIRADYTVKFGSFYEAPEFGSDMASCQPSYVADVTVDGQHSGSCSLNCWNDWERSKTPNFKDRGLNYDEVNADRASMLAFVEAAVKAGVRVGQTIRNPWNETTYRVLCLEPAQVSMFIAASESDSSRAMLLKLHQAPIMGKLAKRIVHNVLKKNRQIRGEAT